MASPTRWTWVWVNSGSWRWTGRPGVLRSMGSQGVGHDWATELNWTDRCFILNSLCSHVIKCYEIRCLSDWAELFVVQLLSRVRLSATPWIAARQASLSITSSQSLPKLMSIEWVMPSSHLILCRPLLLLPSIFPSIRGFSNESALSFAEARTVKRFLFHSWSPNFWPLGGSITMVETSQLQGGGQSHLREKLRQECHHSPQVCSWSWDSA